MRLCTQNFAHTPETIIWMIYFQAQCQCLKAETEQTKKTENPFTENPRDGHQWKDRYTFAKTKPKENQHSFVGQKRKQKQMPSWTEYTSLTRAQCQSVKFLQNKRQQKFAHWWKKIWPPPPPSAPSIIAFGHSMHKCQVPSKSGHHEQNNSAFFDMADW